MGKKDRPKKNRYRAVIAIVIAGIVFLTFPRAEERNFRELLMEDAELELLNALCPVIAAAGDNGRLSVSGWIFPFLGYQSKTKTAQLAQENSDMVEKILLAEGRDEYTGMSGDDTEKNAPTDGRNLSLEELARLENEQAGGRKSGQNGVADGSETDGSSAASDREGQSSGGIETRPGDSQNETGDTANSSGIGDFTASLPEKQRTYNWSELTSYDALVREFYAIDPATAADETQLNQKALLGRVLSVQKRTDDQPQILIYHTHSQETFADSIPGNAQTGIMGVGEVLAEILRKQYGYNVMHHMGQYDVEKRDYAYSNSLPALEAILKENPSIEVVIDLHRDEVAEGTRLVTEIGGKKMARFMFFNGLSRTRRLGDIDSLPNKNIADNLAFSFQMQVLCNEYYPGLTRRIYLKGYRYNMHLKQRYLLIEMGAQTNTYEECMNSCVPLAQMLDLELSGKTDFTLDPEKG